MVRRNAILDDVPGERRDSFGRWILLALGVSLALHMLGWNLSRRIPVEAMSDSYYERIVPRSFQVERVEIDARLLEPPREESVTPARIVPVTLPSEQVLPLSEQAMQPPSKSLPEISQALLDEKPTIPDTLPPMPPASATMLEEADAALREKLLRDMGGVLASSPGPVIKRALPAGSKSAPGFSNLDELLQRTGPLTSATDPILLPGDVLFEYDAHELQSGAVASLEKLGELLRRNPNARFIIEGHSDSYGPEDYNMNLSRLRAESVKAWLISRMGIEGTRIRTSGLGQSRLLVPASESVEGQRINRRVEIVIQSNNP